MKHKTARRFLARNRWKLAMMGDGIGKSFRDRWNKCLIAVGAVPKAKKITRPDGMTIEEKEAMMGLRRT